MKELLVQFAAEQRAAGLLTLREIHHALTAPVDVVTTTEEQAGKSADRLEFEQQVVATVSALMALVAPQVPEAQRLPAVASLNAKQIRDRIRQAIANGMTTANIREVQLLIAELQAFYAAKDGYNVTWPPAADFGAPTYPVTTTTRTPGPSWWAQNFPDQQAPTLNQLREMLK